MIDASKLTKGDVFYQCCEYHWKVKTEFIQVLKDGRIKFKYKQELGIYSIGDIGYLDANDLKYCFIDNDSAKQYQISCKNKIKSKSREELLKEIYNKAESSGIFTSEESKLYRELIFQ